MKQKSNFEKSNLNPSSVHPFLTAFVLLALVLGGLINPAKAADYAVDKAVSKVNWNAKKLTGEHSGTINLASGSLVVNKNQVAGGTFVIDMKSIADTDLKDPEWNKKLIGHLSSDDFFAVEKFPESKLEVKKVTPVSGDDLHFVADLTIKGVTKPVEFDAKVKVNGNSLTASGAITVNRTLYDIRYGSKSFFPNIGDKMIYDDFTLNFEITAQKK
ncbi:MAG: YceI family protein [Marinilabiliales bacterium]|nr:YceI family protein [Marinilabiliales bacterium]